MNQKNGVIFQQVQQLKRSIGLFRILDQMIPASCPLARTITQQASIEFRIIAQYNIKGLETLKDKPFKHMLNKRPIHQGEQ